MADEVIKQKLLLEPEVVDSALSKEANKITTAFAKAVKTGVSSGIKAVGGDFKKVGQMYEQIVDKVGQSPVDVEGFPLPSIGAYDVAQTLGSDKPLSAAVQAMFAAGFATNKPHDFIRSATRETFRANLAEQPTIMGLNVPLEEAARAAREEAAKEKGAKSIQALQARATELAKRVQDPSLPTNVKISLLQQLANVNQSMGRQSFVTNGALSVEDSVTAVQTAADIRAQIAGIRQTIREDAKGTAEWLPKGGLAPRSATQSMMMAERATGITNPLGIQRAVSRIGGGLSATERFAWAYKINDENSKSYWDNRFRNTVEELTAPSDATTRTMHAQWAEEQDALGRSTEAYWQARRKNAVNNIVNGSRMDPEAKEYFKEWIKAQNKNTGSLNSLTSWLKGSGGAIVAGAMATYGIARTASDTVTGIMEGRTAWLSDTQNPYDTQRNIRQQWGKKYGFWAGLLGGAAAGTAIAPGIGTAVGAVAGAVGLTSWAQHNMDQKKIADEYAKYSGSLNIMRALYGENIGFNAANAIQNSSLGNASEILSLNTTSAMMPGAMMFGGLSEQQMLGLSYLPNYWRALMNRENPLDILAAYRYDAEHTDQMALPYLTQLAGLSEGLRGLATSDNFEELYAHKDEWAGMDLRQFENAYKNSHDAIIRARISQEMVDTQFAEQSASTRGNGTGEEKGFWDSNFFQQGPMGFFTQMLHLLANNGGKFGDLNIYIDGVQVARQELKIDDWVGGQTINTAGGN